MAVILSQETQKMIEERLREFSDATADEFVQAAIRNYPSVRGPDVEDLDDETQAAIAEGLAQIERGETMPLAEVEESFRALRATAE